MSDYKYLKATDGTGPAILAHITVERAIGATVLEVDSVDNWPTEFICTTGTILASGFLDPATITEFRGHVDSGDVIIDDFEPGFTDNGNTTDEVAIIKPTGSWADLVAEALRTFTPAGMVVPYAGTTAPDDWLLCYGQSLVRTDYPDLFDAIGTTYGAVDGTHFNVPDLRGRVIAGQDDMGGSSANRLTGATGGVDGDGLGNAGGAETHTLTAAQLAAHAHAFSYGTGTAGSGTGNFSAMRADADTNSKDTTSAGSGSAHNNVQPTLILNYIIKI